MSISNEQINELLGPIKDKLLGMAETSNAPSGLTNTAREIGHVINGDNWEGKVGALTRIYAKIYRISTRPTYRFFDFEDLLYSIERAVVDAARPEAQTPAATKKDLEI